MSERANLNIAGDMKQKVLSTILSDLDCMKLILNRADVAVPALDARYVYVYPWKRIPGVAEEARTFVTFEIAIGSAVNCAVKNYWLNVWVISHESLMPIDSVVGKKLGITDRGTRIDILADKIDYLLNGSKDMGFGKLEIVGSDVFRASNESFVGRNLQYKIQGWNRYGDKL